MRHQRGALSLGQRWAVADGIDGASMIVPAHAWGSGVGPKAAVGCKSSRCTHAGGEVGVKKWHFGTGDAPLHRTGGRAGRRGMGSDSALATAL